MRCENCDDKDHEAVDCPHPRFERCLNNHPIPHGCYLCTHGCASVDENGAINSFRTKKVGRLTIGGFYWHKEQNTLVKVLNEDASVDSSLITVQPFFGAKETFYEWEFYPNFVEVELRVKKA